MPHILSLAFDLAKVNLKIHIEEDECINQICTSSKFFRDEGEQI